MGPVNFFKNYIFEISAFQGKDEACLGFLVKIFTKSVYRGGVTNMKNVMHPNEVDHIELTLHHGKRRADRQRIAQWDETLLKLHFNFYTYKFYNFIEKAKKFLEKTPISNVSKPERIYNPITAMGFSAMFTFQLDNTKR